MKISNRRGFFKYMALLGLVTFSATPLFAKAPKDKVEYQEEPNKGEKCSTCQHFVSKTNECRLVKGTVSSGAWCNLYAANPKLK